MFTSDVARRVLSYVSRRLAPPTQEAEAVYALPDNGSRERVRRQFLHYPPETVGDLVQATPQRKAGQSVVPKPEDEAKETERSCKGMIRISTKRMVLITFKCIFSRESL